MTPRQKNWAEWVAVGIGLLIALAGLYVYATNGGSVSSRVLKLETRVDGHEKQLDRMEQKQDRMLELLEGGKR